MKYKFLSDLHAAVDERMPRDVRRRDPQASEDLRVIVSVGCLAAIDGLNEDDYGYQAIIAPYEAVIRRCEVEHTEWLDNVSAIICQAWADLVQQESADVRDWLLFQLKSFAWEANFHRANAQPQ